jgi:hypothetical protein
MQHTWPSKFLCLIAGPEVSREPFECCQVFENDSAWLSILIMGTSKNHKVKMKWITKWISSLWKHGNALYHQKFTNWQCCVCRRIVVMKLEGSNLLQFPFELASPSFSDSSGLQDNIFDSLWHQITQILYKLPGENWKKWWQLSWFLICLCELSSTRILETVASAIPHYVSWLQRRIGKTNFHHQLWPD